MALILLLFHAVELVVYLGPLLVQLDHLLIHLVYLVSLGTRRI